MRVRLVLSGAVAAAAAFLPVAPAAAYCAELGLPNTVACSPCRPVNEVLTRYGTHVDCFARAAAAPSVCDPVNAILVRYGTHLDCAF